jgi:hypothetical protein
MKISSRQQTEDINEDKKNVICHLKTEIEFEPNEDVFSTQALLKTEGHMLTPKSVERA